MAGDAKAAGGAKKKGGALGLIIGGVLMLGLGGGAFYAVYAGLVPVPEKKAAADPHAAPAEHAEHGEKPPAFLPLSPILVTLGRGAEMRHLQLTAQLEVAPDRLAAVDALTPRMLDVLNTYLRAVDAAVIEDPAAMLRMRAQMLRRVQMVAGEGLVRDLLVSEFILR